MSKHTPGPWRASKELPGIIQRADATRWEPDIGEAFHRKDREERLANARLIAAAPTLLEAAKAARAILQATGEWDALSPIIRDHVEIIKNAIAKAEGGEE